MILTFWENVIRYSLGKKDRLVLASFIFGLVLNVLLWLTLIFFFWNHQEYIVLAQNIYFGFSALGPWYQILVLPLVGLLFLGLNFFLALSLYLNYRFLSLVLIFGAVTANLIIWVAGVLLIYTNI